MAGSDFLLLDRDAAPAGDLAGWLADAVHAAVVDGRLAVGSRLPATRVLARDLGLSRGVVVAAYQRLVDSGVALGAGAAGTRIVTRPAPAPPPPRAPAVVDGVDLTPGVPDLAAFPRAAWLRAERAVLADLDHADLGYGDPRGHPVLRRELAAWLGRTRGVRAVPDDIVVVAGVAQALALLTQVLVGSGVRAMAVEDPGSHGAREELAHWGVEPALQGLDPAHVVHIGSVSKTLAPGLRIGWAVLPEALREPVAHLKWMSDLGNAALPQLVLARLIATGELERHVRRVRPRQRARRDAMLAALAEHLPAARVHGIAAGMHLLVTLPLIDLPGGGEDRELAARAREAGVLVQPLSQHRVAPGPPGLVLGYGAQTPDRIRHGIARLAATLSTAPERRPLTLRACPECAVASSPP